MPSFTGKTKVYGIIGDPVEHSLSPAMHMAFAEQAGLDLAYVPFHVTPKQLPSAMQGLRALNIQGINATVPHKEAVLEHLDELTDEAKGVKAVNTIKNHNGKLIGHNTDAYGFARALDELEDHWGERTSLVIGAGGAARAILHALGKAGAPRIYLANRTESKAVQFAEEYADLPIHPIPLSKEALTKVLPEAGILINASSRGLHGEDHPEISWEALSTNCIIADIVYKQTRTNLVNTALDHGLKTTDGLGMLFYQGLASFEWWTDSTLKAKPVKEMLELWRHPHHSHH